MARRRGRNKAAAPPRATDPRTRQLEHELEVAALLQRHFLPQQPPRVPGYDLGAYLHESEEIGGDFYDFIELPGQRVGIALGDASGKGIPGALLMAQTLGMLRAEAGIEETANGVVTQLNQLLSRHHASDQYVTLFYAVVSGHTDELCYVNAGHPRALLSRAGGIEPLSATGQPLGISADASYAEARATVGPGDVLLIYSDGVTDAQGSDDRFFDEAGIRNVLQQHHDRPVDEIARRVCHAAERFERENPEFSDDKTVVVVRVRNRPDGA